MKIGEYHIICFNVTQKQQKRALKSHEIKKIYSIQISFKIKNFSCKNEQQKGSRFITMKKIRLITSLDNRRMVDK